jgi:hypothetical protein
MMSRLTPFVTTLQLLTGSHSICMSRGIGDAMFERLLQYPHSEHVSSINFTRSTSYYIPSPLFPVRYLLFAEYSVLKNTSPSGDSRSRRFSIPHRYQYPFLSTTQSTTAPLIPRPKKTPNSKPTIAGNTQDHARARCRNFPLKHRAVHVCGEFLLIQNITTTRHLLHHHLAHTTSNAAGLHLHLQT